MMPYSMNFNPHEKQCYQPVLKETLRLRDFKLWNFLGLEFFALVSWGFLALETSED